MNIAIILTIIFVFFSQIMLALLIAIFLQNFRRETLRKIDEVEREISAEIKTRSDIFRRNFRKVRNTNNELEKRMRHTEQIVQLDPANPTFYSANPFKRREDRYEEELRKKIPPVAKVTRVDDELRVGEI